MRDPPRRLSAHRPDAPIELEMVIERCLEKLPDMRFESAHELEQHLAGLRDLPPSLRPTLLAPAPPQSASAPSSTIVMASPELLDETPLPSVRPVVTAAPDPQRRGPAGRARKLAVASFLGLLAFALAFEGPAPETTAPTDAPRAPEEAPPEALPPPESIDPAVPPTDTPARRPASPSPSSSAELAPSEFSESGLITDRHRKAVEGELERARRALAGGHILRARRRVQAAIDRLRGVGIRPNEGVSSLGARASLLRGQVEGAALVALLDEPIERAEAKTVVPLLEQQMMKAKVAYQLVRSWGAPSFYRCAVVETARLQLALGEAFAAGRERAASEEDAEWMFKAAAAWYRKAHKGFRIALRVPAETTLCVDDAKQGVHATDRASARLSR
jgi:hypothetical protein